MNTNNTNLSKLTKNQSGVVAIFVSMILMVVLSIIVLSFSQVAYKEQRAAIDRQISTQAYYSAESGVNDAYSVITYELNHIPAIPISSAPNLDLVTHLPPANYGCNSPSDYSPTGSSNIIDQQTNTNYSCLLVNTQPDTLIYKPPPGNALVTHLKTTAIPNKITFTWDNFDPTTGQSINANCLKFNSSNIYNGTVLQHILPPYGSWPQNTSVEYCPPILEIAIIPVTLGISETSALASERTFYVYPTSTEGGVLVYNQIRNGDILPSNCHNNPNHDCNFVVSVLNQNTSDYYIKILPIYSQQNVNVAISAGNNIYFIDTQAQIDSTGQSQSLLRRIRAAVSLNGSAYGPSSIPPIPLYAIQTNKSICKRLETGQQGGQGFTYESVLFSSPSDIYSNLGGAGDYNIDKSSSATDLSPNGTNIARNDPCNPWYIP